MHFLDLGCCNRDITWSFSISVRGNIHGYIVYQAIYWIKLADGVQL